MQDVVLHGCSKFYSQLDEDAFFRCLGKIKAIKQVDGKGRKLLLKVRTPIDDASLYELIGLLTRYGALKKDKKQLAQFCTPANENWFKDSQKYWFKAVFEGARDRRP